MANVLVKKLTVLKNVMNVSMDILVSPIAKVLYPKLFSTLHILKKWIFCIGCTCNDQGSESATCDAGGKCTCKANIIGSDCDSCEHAYYGFPNCQGNELEINCLGFQFYY